MSDEARRTPTVTVAIPVYKRLEYLPGALRSVAGQDYPAIDLLVSDNGLNDEGLRDLVASHYPHPFRLRRNDEIVRIDRHFDQLTRAAEGDYFVLLADDDELGPGMLAALVAAFEAEPDAGAALARIEAIDEQGRVIEARAGGKEPPPVMRDVEFVRAWCGPGFDFVTFLTFMAPTKLVREVGGYSDFARHGTSIDDSLILKLVLGRSLLFVSDAVFRNRVYEDSHGLSLDYALLAEDLGRYIRHLDDDPVFRAFAKTDPETWEEIHRLQVSMTWRTYRHRWKTMYRSRLSRPEWVKAAFAMPFIPDYYRAVVPYLVRTSLSDVRRRLTGSGKNGGKPAA